MDRASDLHFFDIHARTTHNLAGNMQTGWKVLCLQISDTDLIGELWGAIGMKITRSVRTASMLAVAALLAGGAIGTAVAADEPTNEWATQFFDVKPLLLEGVASQVGSPANVNFIRDGIIETFPGEQEPGGFMVDFIGPLPVGRYEVTLSNFNDDDDIQPVGHYTALTFFEADQLGDDIHPVEVGESTSFFVSLPVADDVVGPFGQDFQEGLSARILLPDNIVVIDPESGAELAGEVTVPIQWDGEMYVTPIQVKAIALGDDPIQVEVWKDDLQVGVPNPGTPNYAGPNTVGSTPVFLEIIGGEVVADLSTMEVVDGDIPQYADGVAQHQVLIHARNAYGYPTAEAIDDLTLTANPSEGVVFGPVTPTGVTGEYKAFLTSTSTGVKFVTAAIDGVDLEAVEGANSAVFAAGPAVATESTITGSTGSVLANGKATHSATVTVRDAAGRPVPGVAVTFDADAALTALTPSANGARDQIVAAVTNDDGQVVVRFTSETPGKFAVSAMVEGEPVNGSPVTFEYAAVPNPDNGGGTDNGGSGNGGSGNDGGQQATKPGSQLAKTGGTASVIFGLLALISLAGTAAVVASRRRL